MSPFNILIIFATFKKCIFLWWKIQFKSTQLYWHIGLFKLRFGEGIFVCLRSLSTSFNANSYSMMCTIEILYQHWWHSLFIFDFKTPFQYEHWGCSFEDIDIKGWNSKLFSHLNKKLSCFVTFKKILESFEKFILHDFYSKWTIAGCFFDKKG